MIPGSGVGGILREALARNQVKPPHVSAVSCHGFVTERLETDGNGWDTPGFSATEKPYGITLFGNGWDWLESPSEGSTPGHPIENRYFAGTFAVLVFYFLTGASALNSEGDFRPGEKVTDNGGLQDCRADFGC
jgi:hypothetical protein